MVENSPLRAFRLTVPGWPDVESIYISTSASKARYSSFLAAQDAGFRNLSFADLKVRRAPEFDAIIPGAGRRSGLSIEVARELLGRAIAKKSLPDPRILDAFAVLSGYGPAVERAGHAREILAALLFPATAHPETAAA